MSRPMAREAAMQLIFEQLFGGEGEPETLVDLIEYTPEGQDTNYLDTVINGVREHAAEIDNMISDCLRGWTLERISKVDYAVLRLAVYEMVYMKLPAGIAINEAVELTRKYSGENSCPFVNGVLGSIHRKMDSIK